MELMENRILGALYGICIGDSMGMPVEMWSRKCIKNRYGWIDNFHDAPPEQEIGSGLKAGACTDDTFNTVIVAETLIANNGKINIIDYINRLERWISQSPTNIAVVGPSTKRALSAICKGVSLAEAGKYGTTNGASMKIAPVGMIYSTCEFQLMIAQVSELCQPTHFTGTAIAGACAVASAFSNAVSGQINFDDIFQQAVNAADIGMNLGHDVFSASVSRRIVLARQFVDQSINAESALQTIYDCIGSGLPSAESIPAALAIAYLAKGDPVTCAYYCANLGGDTDTIGAIAVGICGAISGIEAFPDSWINLISKVNPIDFVSLAHQLYKIRIRN